MLDFFKVMIDHPFETVIILGTIGFFISSIVSAFRGKSDET
jgi:hypothetical protein